MVPQSEVTLNLVQNGNTHCTTFPPETLHIENLGNGTGVVRSFVYNGNEYFLHEYGTHPQTTAQKAKNFVAHAMGDGTSASVGGHLGQGYGKKGTIIGALAGLTVYEIVSHLPQHAHSDDGYYNNGQKYFDGPITVNLR